MMHYPVHLSYEVVEDRPLYAVYRISSSATDKKPPLCIVPSIFNRSVLMFLPEKHSLVDHLLSLGDVYIIEWKSAPQAEIGINDYSHAVSEAITTINTEQRMQPVVIAHSFGCILSSIAASINPALCNHLIFLAPPWDFTKYHNLVRLLKFSGIYYLLKLCKYIHTRWLPAALYFINPSWILHDIRRYYSSKNTQSFWQFKKWQFSGYKISYNTAQQIMDQLIAKGGWPVRWRVGNAKLNLRDYNGKVSVVIGLKDKVIPKNSSLAIKGCFRNCSMYKVDAGHVGCITGANVGATNAIIDKVLGYSAQK